MTMASGNLLFWAGHGEGHTEICYDSSGSTVFTCGADGNIKLWTEFASSGRKPKSIKAGDVVYTFAAKGDVIYAATDNNSVDKYNLADDGLPDGILLRFAGNVTHLSLSESQNTIVAGSSDFTAKSIDLETNEEKVFAGHKAPIISIAADPLDEFLATVSCDGDLRIWSTFDTTVVEIVSIMKPCNDICNAESLSRMSWRPSTGEDIAVSSGSEVKVFARGTWSLMHSFKTAFSDKPFNCCCFSPCGRFLAAATVDGWICVWDAETQDCLQTVQHALRTSVCCVAWDPRENNTLAVADVRGQVGLLKDVVPSKTEANQNSVPDDLDALFENEDGDIEDFFDDAAAESDSGQRGDALGDKKEGKDALGEDGDMEVDDRKQTQGSDFDIPSTNVLFSAEDDLAPPVIPSTAKPLDEEDASSSISELLGDPHSKFNEPKQAYRGPDATAMQPAFQPGATPTHLSHRFMVWNSVGTIRSYSDDSESVIDVEFHDKQHHYALHFNNEAPLGGGAHHTMADLSMNAVAMASESTEDYSSKLTCMYYASWEGNKEWSIEMPDDEEIKALTIGESWVAVCTDARLVRMFSLAGMQRLVFSIPGPVVAMSAHTDQLLIVYHTSQGFNSNQCLGYMLLEVGVGTTGANRSKKIVGGEPLPIGKKSLLRWIGFSAEGTPATVDSSGVVRMMNRGFCNAWIPVSNLRKLTKSRHDHYWVIGLHENPQELRAIMCKGSTYPSTIPRPFPTVLQYKLPLCEPDSEKTKFEEEYWRSRIFSSHAEYLKSHGFETDDKYEQSTKVLLQQTLMKLFALACKTDRESRALEVCDLMPSSSSVNLAIKYASRLKRMVLAQKLGEVVQDKTREEMEAFMKMERRQARAVDDSEDEQEDENQDDFRQDLQAGYSQASTEWAEHKVVTLKKARPREDFGVKKLEQNDKEHTPEEDPSVDVLPDLRRSAISSGPAELKLSTSLRNPFKKKFPAPTIIPSSQGSARDEEPVAVTSVLDGIARNSSAQKLRGVIAKSHNTLKKPSTKRAVSKDVKKQQTLPFGTKSHFRMTSTPKGKKPPHAASDEAETQQRDVTQQILRDVKNECTTGVQLFVSHSRPEISEANPGLDGLEIQKLAIQAFRDLTQEERQSWNDRARKAGVDDVVIANGVKRKLDDADDDRSREADENAFRPGGEATKQPSSKSRKIEDSERKSGETSTRLAAFAYDVSE